ncbi:hypothetical protein RA276_29820, partial [Pseudomonas syringae pv. tagetis]|uniref:hypothetical protein n=1 Tax=Pseudomonas syringae group genomosp. 7 TaxID=251699 RepID=UPI00376F6A87
IEQLPGQIEHGQPVRGGYFSCAAHRVGGLGLAGGREVVLGPGGGGRARVSAGVHDISLGVLASSVCLFGAGVRLGVRVAVDFGD